MEAAERTAHEHSKQVLRQAIAEAQ